MQFEDYFTEDDGSPTATRSEIIHYGMMHEIPVSIESFTGGKAHYFACRYLDVIEGSLKSVLPDLELSRFANALSNRYAFLRLNFSRNRNWGFPFVAKVEDGSSPSGFTYYSDTPRSDFQLRIDGFPHLLVQMESDLYWYDRTRMLIQAACTVRLAQSWLNDKTKSVVLMALYIDKFLIAHRYLIYQPDSTKPTVSLPVVPCII
jgi:hypothetical protein